MSCSRAPVPRSSRSGSAICSERASSSETTVTFIAWAVARSLSGSPSRRTHRSPSTSILSSMARESCSAASRACCGSAPRRSVILRRSRQASMYWRSQTRREDCCCSIQAASARRAASAGSTGRSVVVAGWGATSPGSTATGSGSLRSGLQRSCFRPKPRITSICSIELILKLDSGKGWDIQPTSRWTNMPTRKSSTATIAVADISVPPRKSHLDGDLVRICFGHRPGKLEPSLGGAYSLK